MKLVDSNVWLAVAISSHEHHALASAWLRQQSVKDVAFCRNTQLSFLRLITTRAVLNVYGIPPLTNKQAMELYAALIGSPQITFAGEPDELEIHWRGLISVDTSSPKLWMDAYLAAFAIAGGHQLVTIDSGFAQFESLDLLLLR